MIKRNQTYLNRLNALIDFVLVVLAYMLSSWLRLYVLHGFTGNIALTRSMILASVVYAAGLMLVLALAGFYSVTRTRRISWKLQVLLASVTGTILGASALLFAFRLEDFSRGVLILFYLLTLVFLGGKQIAMRLVLNRLRSSGYNIKHEVLIGNGALAEQYRRDVADEPELGIQIDAIVQLELDHNADFSTSGNNAVFFEGQAMDYPAHKESADQGFTPIANMQEIAEKLSWVDIDEAVIALEPEEYKFLKNIIGACERNGVKYYVIPFYNDLIPTHPVFENVGRSKLINMRSNSLEQIGWASVKRCFDILVSLIGLIVLSPLLVFLAIGVKLSSPGPVFFRQTRVGFNRKQFSMIKFRSMKVNDQSDTAWSTAGDSRITKFGSFIRKTSLDELPQLWNVLRGEMSLVGPRPELPHFVEQFRETVPLYMMKHQVKPGITGWAQVNGYRGDTSITKRIELDLWYIDNWSPWLDLKILFRTVLFCMVHDESEADPDQEQDQDPDIKVIVASHKPYWMPSDPLYVPVHVGAAINKDGISNDKVFTPDDTGDNISSRNSNYCELTGLYWAWKNLPADYIGLAHYRRHFTMLRGTSDRRDVLSLEQARQLFRSADVLLPKKRNYWIETNYSQYVHAHHAEDLDVTREIISENYPEYADAFDQVMKKKTGHRFNMFIMKRELADQYCKWLFDVLFELEDRLDISGYSDNDKRVFGFVAERLLDVWLETNQVKYKEIPYMFLERQNWVTKIARFLKRKMEGGKS